MDEKELQLRSAIKEIEGELFESKIKLFDLKKRFDAEETITIGLKLRQDNAEMQLRSYLASLSDRECSARKNVEIDQEFRSKLPSLLEKV